jgi:hypothetical protein
MSELLITELRKQNKVLKGIAGASALIAICLLAFYSNAFGFFTCNKSPRVLISVVINIRNRYVEQSNGT